MSGVPSYPRLRGVPGYSLQVKELAHLLLQRLGNRKPHKKSISLTMFIYTQKTCH